MWTGQLQERFWYPRLLTFIGILVETHHLVPLKRVYTPGHDSLHFGRLTILQKSVTMMKKIEDGAGT